MTGKSTTTIKSMTTIKTTILALATAATLGTGFGAFEARAQYDDGDDDRPRRFERRYDADRYEHRRYDEDRYDRRPRGYGGGFGRLCLTQRGNCITRPQPYGSRCGCDIPGFGRKHGEIGG